MDYNSFRYYYPPRPEVKSPPSGLDTYERMGFHTGSEIKKVQDLGINVLVAVPNVASNAPDTNYNVANFIYNKDQDFYICPAGQTLNTNARWYDKNRGNNRETIRVKQYKTKLCKQCLVKDKCTTSIKNGRVIERSEFAENLEQNKQNVEQNKKLYKRRQAIVEHPFGTIKRQWGFSYIITKKGLQRASSDIGLMFTVYNLRRILNIIGFKKLVEYLKQILLYFFVKIHLHKLKISHFKDSSFCQILSNLFFVVSLNRTTFNQNLKIAGGY